MKATTSATVTVPTGETMASMAESLRWASVVASSKPIDSSSTSVPVTTAMATMAMIAHMHGGGTSQPVRLAATGSVQRRVCGRSRARGRRLRNHRAPANMLNKNLLAEAKALDDARP